MAINHEIIPQKDKQSDKKFKKSPVDSGWKGYLLPNKK